ncbi:nucleotidyltransferase domain-containing protein [Candidatus Woesearchaeota archaeon]|nr:nucleotidyltransferase domain-containing protein [Candidatus Woesearchaeota archaeon]
MELDSSKTKKIQKIKQKVLDTVLMSKQDESRLYKKVDNIISQLTKSAVKLGFDVSIELGGSSAKKTFLKGDFDCDVFVRFDYKKYKSKNEELSKYLFEILSNAKIQFNEVKGSRNYFQFTKEDIDFEIVPVLRLNKISDALNVTDASPFHVHWFNKNSKNSLNNEVRLAKLFCKAQKIYGAESYVKGFSGHVLDILTINFGSFENVINFFAKQNMVDKLKKYDPSKIIVDVSKFYKNKNTLDILKNLNSSKIDSPLIVVDPISKDRNASSALSIEKYNYMVSACRNFLQKPSESFFKIKPYQDSDIKKWISNFNERGFDVQALVVKIIPLEGKKDVIGAKVMKIVDFISNKLMFYGFNVYDFGFEFNKKSSIAWLFIDIKELKKSYDFYGPKADSKIHAKRFLEKHVTAIEKNGVLCAKVTRKYTNGLTCLNDIIQDSYVSSRCKELNVKLL